MKLYSRQRERVARSDEAKGSSPFRSTFSFSFQNSYNSDDKLSKVTTRNNLHYKVIPRNPFVIF